MGLPVNPRCTGRFGLFADGFDERASDATATQGWEREQILEVAGWLNQSGAAMEKVVDETSGVALIEGDQREDRFIGVQEALPSGLRDFVRERGFVFAAIEGVVSIPERLPVWVVGWDDGADDDGWGGHDGKDNVWVLGGLTLMRRGGAFAVARPDFTRIFRRCSIRPGSRVG